MYLKKIVKIVFCLALVYAAASVFTVAHAQVQSHQTTVINFLGRMAQKGKIEFNDLIKPIDRKIIFQKLFCFGPSGVDLLVFESFKLFS